MRPNILLITTDQQRFDTLQAAGNPAIFTPHLNWLADTGIRYTRGYSDAPVCAPARATIMTGQHAWHHGQVTNSGAVSPMADRPTLPGLLTAAGYQTRLVGKPTPAPFTAIYAGYGSNPQPLFLMTPRERLLAVYLGQQPDAVPALADLSYWHAGHGGGKFIPGRTDGANHDKIDALLALHRQTGAAIHVNLGSFYREVHGDTVKVISGIRGEQYHHRFETPIGTVEEIREWSPVSFSWPIIQHMVRGPSDLPVIRYVFERIAYAADWNAYHAVDAQVGDIGLPLAALPYTGMGFFMSRYAGVEQTVMLALDEAEEFEATLQAINDAHARACRLMAEGPSQVLFHSDNLSADVQSPPWFERYSAGHFQCMAAIAHEYGKPIVTHIDGRLRGLLRSTRDSGIDGADAVTPAPWGDLTPQQCRDEAGPDYVLSGGVPPDSFNPNVPLAVFDAQVEAWLALRHQSSALIIAPGDQLPPDGDLDRVRRMVEAANQATYQ